MPLSSPFAPSRCASNGLLKFIAARRVPEGAISTLSAVLTGCADTATVARSELSADNAILNILASSVKRKLEHTKHQDGAPEIPSTGSELAYSGPGDNRILTV
jgi:hypothetical protein